LIFARPVSRDICLVKCYVAKFSNLSGNSYLIIAIGKPLNVETSHPMLFPRTSSDFNYNIFKLNNIY